MDRHVFESKDRTYLSICWPFDRGEFTKLNMSLAARILLPKLAHFLTNGSLLTIVYRESSGSDRNAMGQLRSHDLSPCLVNVTGLLHCL